tara:strand:+ start:3792 stop:4097 length:306 start_codon:yes stop_codon:yes gene_type:complete
MPNKSKQKGNRFERECAGKCKKRNIECKRAYASNGESLGLKADVDLLINNNIAVQCKVRKKIPLWIKPPKSCSITLVKEDRGEIYTIIRYEDYLKLIDKER